MAAPRLMPWRLGTGKQVSRPADDQRHHLVLLHHQYRRPFLQPGKVDGVSANDDLGILRRLEIRHLVVLA